MPPLINKSILLMITFFEFTYKGKSSRIIRNRSVNHETVRGWILNYLFSCGERATYATDIHAECGISRAAISSMLKGLKKGGYIEMRAVSGDDRKKRITLTAKAYSARETIGSVLKRQMERLCSGLSGEELELFTYTLNRMISNIKTDCVKEE